MQSQTFPFPTSTCNFNRMGVRFAVSRPWNEKGLTFVMPSFFPRCLAGAVHIYAYHSHKVGWMKRINDVIIAGAVERTNR
jgi:hypothetical protein